jgi:hypothetical protein
MTASAARIATNRRNSASSTDSRTALDEEMSRSSSLKHGLCASVVEAEDPVDVLECAAALSEFSSPPAGSFGAWLVNQIATLSLKIERAQDMEEAALDRIALRAGVTWEDDRRFEATLLGGRIGHRPDQVAERLRQTPQGCRWMMSRWAMLAHAADQGKGWTPEQASLAFDLLGSPLTFREGNQPGAAIDLEGRATGPVVDPATLARREIDALKQRAELTRELDDADRKRAEAGLADDAEVRRLRRYESALQRRLQWTIEILQRASAPQEQGPSTDPEPPAEPPAAPVPTREVAERPPIAQKSQPPRRSASRAEEKLKKAEARCEAKLRKLGKVRA